MRQGKHLAQNLVATLRGRRIFQCKGIVIKGLPAWLMHRGYHVLAVPTWERKIRVLAVWLTAAPFGRDLVSLASVQQPRDAFVASGEAQGFGASRASAETAA
jgi:NADH dehydrogenase